MFQHLKGHKRGLSLLLAFVCCLALSLPARADVIVIIDSDLPFVSPNIDVLGTIPIAGAISANFKGQYMYVTGLSGLTTVDISNPAAPRLTDLDPLPHFENEDVTLGGNLLLISNDSAEGVGVLYIFDISNPAAPVLRGKPFLLDTILGTMPSHTATCIQACKYVYLAGNSDGITIIDLRNPDAPRVAGKFTPPITGWATHDVNVDSANFVWIVGAGGTAAYSIADPLRPVLVGKTDFTGTTGLNDFIHHNSIRPQVVLADGTKKHGSVLLVTEEDYERPTCQDAGSFQTWQISGALSANKPAVLKNLDSWATELDELTRTAGHSPATVLCSAHWFDERAGLVAQGWYEQGTRILDVRNPRDIKQVGYFVMPGTETWAANWAPTDPRGEIFYTVDLSRGIDILRFNRTASATLPALVAPVRQSWLATGTNAGVPAAQFSVAHRDFGWACRIPTVLP